MIKLETTSLGISALALVSIVSNSPTPSISLSCDKSRKLDPATQQWADDPTKVKQLLTFVGMDGPVELTGIVPEAAGIEIAAAHRVVAMVDVSTRNLPASKAGGFSRSVVSLGLVQVVEVWESATKCLWRDKAFTTTGPGKVFSMETGKISAA